MKTHYLILVLALLAAVLLAACAQATPAATTAAPTSAPAATSVPATKTFRVAVVAPSAANDLAFTQSMVDALKALQQQMGGKDKFDFVVTENMFNVSDAATALRDYANKGYDLVIAHGSQYGASLADIAPDFPKTSFAWGTAVDTYSSKGIKNIFAYTVASDQGGYVEGVIGAKLSKKHVLAALGPIPAGDGQLTIQGFSAGVKATDPTAKVQTTFTQSFSDVSLMSQAAQTQIASGADVLTGTSQSVIGAISVCKDKGALWFGNQSDQASLAPNIVVASQVYDWTIALNGMLNDIHNGKLGDDVFTMTFKNGGLKMVYNPGYNMPADVKTLADKTVQGLSDASIQTGVKGQ